jgi:hypothetical protein
VVFFICLCIDWIRFASYFNTIALFDFQPREPDNAGTTSCRIRDLTKNRYPPKYVSFFLV